MSLGKTLAYGAKTWAVAAQLRSGVRTVVANDVAFAAVKGDGSVVTWGISGSGGDSDAVAQELSGGVRTKE